MKVRLPKGMGGGPSDMNSMIRQAQKMQEQMAEKQAELDEREARDSLRLRCRKLLDLLGRFGE